MTNFIKDLNHGEINMNQQSIDSKRKTLIFSGAGASRHSWDSVVKGIQNAIPNSTVSKNNANYIFANLVSQIRWLNYKKTQSVKSRDNLEILYNNHISLLSKLRQSIADQLAVDEENGSIFLDENILGRIGSLIGNNAVAVITTNWDMLWEKNGLFNKHSVNYLHGSRDTPNLMYLPSETIEDEHREKSEREHLGKLAGECMKEIENADQIIIYGLSFSPLDSELGTIWRDGFVGSEKKQEIFLVDPNPYPILDTLKYLTPDIDVQIPSNMF